MSKHQVYDILKDRILVLDGAMGSLIQGYGLEEEDFRNHPLLADREKPLKGNNDLMLKGITDYIYTIPGKTDITKIVKEYFKTNGYDFDSNEEDEDDDDWEDEDW